MPMKSKPVVMLSERVVQSREDAIGALNEYEGNLHLTLRSVPRTSKAFRADDKYNFIVSEIARVQAARRVLGDD